MKKKETVPVPCKWCGLPTLMTGTKMCDRCWELDGRISRDPKIAREILASIDRAAPAVPPEEGKAKGDGHWDVRPI